MLLSGCCLSERLLDYILQRVILCVADRLAPLVAAVLAGNLNGDMAEPAVGLRTVPVLDVRGDGDDIADAQALRGLALLLIPALAVDADEQLSAAALRVVDVPVVAALNWTTSPQSLVVAGFNGIHICAL